jgi:hypothetical protein
MTEPDFNEQHLGLSVSLMPERLRTEMARATCILIADELLRAQTVDQVRSFRSPLVAHPLDPDPAPAPALDDPEFSGALDWLVDEASALTREDVERTWDVRRHAVELTRRAGDLVLAGEVRFSLITEVSRLLQKLGVFWVRMDLDLRGEDHGEVADGDIRSGVAIFFDALAAAAMEV